MVQIQLSKTSVKLWTNVMNLAEKKKPKLKGDQK